MTIQKVGIIGAGQMGNGIAHVAALAGRDIVLLDVDAACVEKGRKTIEKNMGRLVEKGKVTAEAGAAALARVLASTRPGGRT